MKINFLAGCVMLCLAPAIPVICFAGESGQQATAAPADRSEPTITSLERRVRSLQVQLGQLEDEVKRMKGKTLQAEREARSASGTSNKAVSLAAKSGKRREATQTGKVPTITVHGFFDASAFYQDKNFEAGNGQDGLFPAPGAHGSVSGADVRNTRVIVTTSPVALDRGWNASGYLEADFFGGFNGSGAFSQQQPLLRLRQAYIQLTRESTGTSLKIGQQWVLMAPTSAFPVSLIHVAFPLGFGGGLIGAWRYPGISVSQNLNHATTGVQWTLSVGAYSGNWNGPGSNINFETAGNPGFRPQLEARLMAQDKNDKLTSWVTVHWSRIDLQGVGGSATVPQSLPHDFASRAIQVGIRWMPGSWDIGGIGYTGAATATILGNLLQFGDIEGSGGYLDVGYHISPRWSLYLFDGVAKPKSPDVIRWMGHGANGLLRDRQASFSVMYSVNKYLLSIEYLNSKLRSTTNGVDRETTVGNQLSVNAMYRF